MDDETEKDNWSDALKLFLTIVAGLVAHGLITTGGTAVRVITSMGFMAAFYVIWFCFKNE